MIGNLISYRLPSLFALASVLVFFMLQRRGHRTQHVPNPHRQDMISYRLLQPLSQSTNKCTYLFGIEWDGGNVSFFAKRRQGGCTCPRRYA